MMKTVFLLLLGLLTSCAYYTVDARYMGNDTYEAFAESSTPTGAKAKALQKAAELASRNGFTYVLILAGEGERASWFVTSVGGNYYTATLRVQF